MSNLLGVKRLSCWKFVNKECVWFTVARVYGDRIEVWRGRKRGDGIEYKHLMTIPPHLGIYHEVFTDEDYYMDRDSNGRIIALSSQFLEFIKQLKRHYAGVRDVPELRDAFNSLARRYASPGITEDGIVADELVLNDYGVDGLIEAYKWVRDSGLNVEYALANIAFLIAKVFTPLVARYGVAFLDHIIWNYEEGNVGGVLARHVLLPLLGLGGATEMYAYINDSHIIGFGGAPWELFLWNRLPLVLDLQKLPMRMAMRAFDIQAEALRGLILFTRTPFRQFLRRVKDSKDWYARRVITINWGRAKTTIEQSPGIRPILGALNNIFLKYKNVFLRKPNGLVDLVDLTKLIFNLLIREYTTEGSEERKILEEYISAVDEVYNKLEEEEKDDWPY